MSVPNLMPSIVAVDRNGETKRFEASDICFHNTGSGDMTVTVRACFMSNEGVPMIMTHDDKLLRCRDCAVWNQSEYDQSEEPEENPAGPVELADVEVLEEQSYGGYRTWRVTPIWRGVKRTRGSSTLLTSKNDAERLAAAFKNGWAYSSVEIAIDANGSSYAKYSRNFTGLNIKGWLDEMEKNGGKS